MFLGLLFRARTPDAGFRAAGGPLRAAAASVVVAGLVLVGGAMPAEAATSYSAPLRTAVKSLPVAAENNVGYDRARQFGDWNDANRDCQNTRAEVLQNESKVTTGFTATSGAP